MASASAPAHLFPDAHNVQIMGGTFNAVQGDVHYHAEGSGGSRSEAAIWKALRAVPNFRKIYQDMLSKATKGTGMWLLKNEKFRIWLEANGNLKIFWGSGMPGAGKTVLASLVIEHLEALRRDSESPNQICVCFFYFRYSDNTDLTVKGVLETLLKQTLERHPDAFGLVGKEYEQHKKEGTQPSETQLLGFLQKLAGKRAVTFYVLDALDEAPPALQAAIVRTLSSLNVKLFITSRPLETVQGAFPQAYPFRIRADEGDIELHVTKGISNSPVLLNLVKQEGLRLRADILAKVKEKSDGMFLHAAFQMDALGSCVNLRQVRRILEEFPSQIEGAYVQTWNRILDEGEENVALVEMVFVWVLNATRSMMLEELERVVAICPRTFKYEADRVVPGSTFLAMCRGLLVVEEESQIVRLVHYTAKNQLQQLLEDSFPHPDSLLTNVCIAHLIESGFQDTKIASREEFTAALESDSLLAYSSKAWALHACQSLSVTSTMECVVQFVQESKAFLAFTNINQTYYFDILSPLHIIAVYHLPLDFAIDLEHDCNSLTSLLHQSPLMLACEFGHQRLVERLLASPGVLINLTDNNGLFALMRASANGHTGVNSLLLAHPDIQVNLVVNSGDSALMQAVLMGYNGIVVALLAHPDIQVNLVNNTGDSALMQAVLMGYNGIVAALLAHPDIQVNLVNNTGDSALIQAVAWGYNGIVAALLAHPDIQVNLVNDSGDSALMQAVAWGSNSSMMTLLAHPDIQVNLVNQYGDSALMKAVFRDSNSSVMALLARPDIQVNLVNQNGWSALMRASHSGHVDVFKALYDTRQFDANHASSYGSTALLLAAEYGHEHIVRLLLDIPSIDWAAKDNNGDTAMSYAQKQGNTGIVILLKEFEARHSLPLESDDVQEALPVTSGVVEAPPSRHDPPQEFELERSAPSTHDLANTPEGSQEGVDLVEHPPLRPDPPQELDMQRPTASSDKPVDVLEALAKEGDIPGQPPWKSDLFEPESPAAASLPVLNQRGGNRSKSHLCCLIWTCVFVCGVAVLCQRYGLHLWLS